MSWKATAFVKEINQGISQQEKFVLLILADYHHTTSGAAWPSLRELAKDCLMSERNLRRILGKLELDKFIRRRIGVGRGNITAYEICGLDFLKADNLSPFNSVKADTKEDKPSRAIRKEPVLEPVIYKSSCEVHKNSGLTPWGSCWTCYQEKFSAKGASA